MITTPGVMNSRYEPCAASKPGMSATGLNSSPNSSSQMIGWTSVAAANAGQRGQSGGDVVLGEFDDHRVAAQLALERFRRPLHDHPAGVDDRQPRGEPVGLVEVVRGEQDGDVLLGGEPADLAPHLRAR